MKLPPTVGTAPEGARLIGELNGPCFVFRVESRDAAARTGELLGTATPALVHPEGPWPGAAPIALANGGQTLDFAEKSLAVPLLHPTPVVIKDQVTEPVANEDVISLGPRVEKGSFIGQGVAVLHGWAREGGRRDNHGLVEHILALRGRSPATAIYLPGVAEPLEFALLAYLGVDLFDTTAIIRAALAGRVVSLEPHPALTAHHDGFEERVAAGVEIAHQELDRVRVAIQKGVLRDLVEVRANQHPAAMEWLRIADYTGLEQLERWQPRWRPELRSIGREALVRPEVRLYRQRLRDREFYRLPRAAKIAVLLPCSFTKPYSVSPSHRRLGTAINFPAAHPVMVTSPLGLVPRELEQFFPAMHYDIPTVGIWDAQEESVISQQLSHICALGYEKVVVHEKIDMDVPAPAGVEVFHTCKDGRPTSNESLDSLRDKLNELARDIPVPGRRERLLDEMKVRLRFQFGALGEALIDEAGKAMGRYPRLKVLDEKGEQLFMISERGSLSPTKLGTQRMYDLRINVVKMQEFELEGDLFCVGVIEAPEHIREGDFVTVESGGKLVAGGIAALPGSEMTAGRIAVKTRHKIRED